MIDYIPYRILAKVNGMETQGTVIFMDGFSEKDGRPGVTVYAEMDCGGSNPNITTKFNTRVFITRMFFSVEHFN